MKKTTCFLNILCAVFFCFVPMDIITAQTEQAQWSAVMAGETLCDPVLYGEHLYLLSSDQALNCIDYTGSFVWRRNIKRTRKPVLAVSNSGVLIIADESRKLQAVSSQGIYLWAIQLPEPALYPPYCTTDGRICVLTQSSLYCFSIKGTLKWQIKLSAPPARQLCETGVASLLLTLTNKDFLTVSLTGQLVSTKTLKKEITALSAAPAGYVMSTHDGILAYYRSEPQTTEKQGTAAETADGFAVWQIQEATPLFMRNFGDELVCVYADGSVSTRNITSPDFNWTVQLNSRITLPLYCNKIDGEYHLSCKSIAAIISETGTVKREQKISSAAFLPLITPSGILVAVDDWVINSQQLDTKIMKTTPQTKAPPQYHLLKTQEKTQTLPFFIPYGDTAAILAKINEAVSKGTIGTNEASYALTLQTILVNNRRAAYFPYNFTVHERAQAAEVLGLLESLEYRAILLDEASKTSEPVLAVAIIRALGFVAADPDGSSIEAIRLLLRRCGVRVYETAYTACDALTEIAKYGDKHTAESAVKALFEIAANAYPENIKQYARQKIKTIVE